MPHYLLSIPSKCIWSGSKPIKPLRSPSQMCAMKANFVANFSCPFFFFLAPTMEISFFNKKCLPNLKLVHSFNSCD
jgi:hypothetical protein